MAWYECSLSVSTMTLKTTQFDCVSTIAGATLNTPELAYMAEHFFGYGKWEAPYWFIGPEAGMAKAGDSLELRYRSWKQLGSAPVVDCAAHHRGFGFLKWHQDEPPTQATWRQLIRLLLAYKGHPTDTESIREYQRDKWGSSRGETCVIELSGLAAPSMRSERDRTTFLARRVARIRELLTNHSPEFVVLYGQGDRAQFERIAQKTFDSNGLGGIGNTVGMIASHPVTTGLRNEYWVNLGQTLRKQVDNDQH